MTLVYKICPRSDWQRAEAAGSYRGSIDDQRDGFIHLSAGPQVEGTLTRHFSGQSDLVLVAFDEQSLAGLRWEASRGGALFPHVYGVLPVAQALWVKDLPLDEALA
jgi:uncharacterized protein (DUF952 family)